MTTTDDVFDEELELALIEHQQGQLIDKHGHRHSEAVFRNWTPKAIRALGIHRVDDQFPPTSHDKDKDNAPDK